MLVRVRRTGSQLLVGVDARLQTDQDRAMNAAAAKPCVLRVGVYLTTMSLGAWVCGQALPMAFRQLPGRG